MNSFEIVNIAELSTSQVLDVINTAFGRSESTDWYEWKHREGPWGPSIGVVAVDRSGPIGVRLLLPWRLRLGGTALSGHRATEAATIPRAQGQGVFTALNRWMMEEVQTDLIFSTPNLNSRGGYLKLGWSEIARVPHRWELPAKPRSGTVIRPTPEGTLRTDWDLGALRWRSDPRSGHLYDVAVSGDDVLYYRVFRRRGIRVVAPLASLGDPAQLALLWAEMLARTRARILLRPATQPVPEPPPRLAVQRGESLVLGWNSGRGLLKLSDEVTSSVPWSAADIEGVM